MVPLRKVVRFPSQYSIRDRSFIVFTFHKDIVDGSIKLIKLSALLTFNNNSDGVAAPF